MECISGVPRRIMGGQQEYLLQGSIMDGAFEVLVHRLRGLCDNADSPIESFQDYELVFQIRGPTGTPVTVRARQSLDSPQMPRHLRYVGQPEVGDRGRHTLVRSVIDVGTSNNLITFLNEIGCRLDFEYVLKGHLFQKGRMKVVVAKVFRLLQQGNPESIEPLSQSHIIELSVVAPAGQESLGDEMKMFADQLKPLVELEKIDHTRLQHV
ncbi:mediator of RNA polymerase II transcription subunit 18-like [Ornithodoros turicata]|uniref:mediator of RNA polymerase II transcription subunit 18-like n=1 Tax=Ornithodoros turicata TaxID=34597 RepID=UPI00313980C1